jgi:hypothetical protein
MGARLLAGSVIALGLVACGHTQEAGTSHTEDGLLRDYRPLAAASAPSRSGSAAPVVASDDAVETATFTTAVPARRARALPAEGTLSLDAETKARCAVELSGKRVGVAPLRDVTVPAGKHQLVVTCKGTKRLIRQIAVSAGEHLTFEVARGKLTQAKNPSVARGGRDSRAVNL